MQKTITFQQSRQGIWEYIRQNKTFSIQDILVATKLTQPNVSLYINALIKGGWLEIVKIQAKKKAIYRLVKDTGRAAPNLDRDGNAKAPNGYERMWFAIKAMGKFSVLDLALTASVSKHTAQIYVTALKKAKYLGVFRAAQKGKKEILIFLRTKDTGPLPPKVFSTSIYDQNTKEIVWRKAVAA